MMEERKFIPNNNKPVVRMLSKEFGRYNRGRNRILTGAVSLCIITLTMVFGIAFGKVKAEYTRSVRTAGTSASACIEGAGQAQYGKIRSLSYVKKAGRSVFAGEGMIEEDSAREDTSEESGQREKRVCWVRVLDKQAWKELVKPAYTDIYGHYPVKRQQIMLSVKVLKDMGIDKPKKGMKINLTVNIGLFRTEEEEFSLCGWYTDYVEDQWDSKIGYISEEKYKEWGYDLERQSDILICQSDDMNWQEAEKRLYEDVAGETELKITVRNTFSHDAVNRLAGSFDTAVLGAFIILGGMFFLIYNVMHISMAGDVRQMGLLNMLGATRKQIRGVYFEQIINILIPAVLAGSVLSAVILQFVIPGILGRQYLSRFGGAGEVRFFEPEILIASAAFSALLVMAVSMGVISRAVNESCVESVKYTSPVRAGRSVKVRLNDKKGDGKVRVNLKRRSADRELWYMAWHNLTRYRGRFVVTVCSLFLGIVAFLGMIIVTRDNDYVHVIEKRPDFLIAGAFSRWGQEEGYGNEYRTLDAEKAPMETEGDNFFLLYGNTYDEFSPISPEVRESLLNLDGVKKETSYVMEGAYMLSTISRKGIEPLIDDFNENAKVQEGIGYSEEYSMVEGFYEDVIQILKKGEMAALQKYAKENALPIDMDSLENGTGVLIIHDHKLSPQQEKAAAESVGEPLYFTAMCRKEEEILWNQMSSKERDAAEQSAEAKKRLKERQSPDFSLSGYLDNRAEEFPHIRQTWHGAEGSIYYLISEKGFEKLPTNKKTLYMELDTEKEKEPELKSRIQNIVRQENRKRSETPGTGEEAAEGEAGIFVISKSDLLSEWESYIRGSRMILGSISAVLLFAGLANYFNVMATGIISRKKEFEIMESVGMTKRQMRKLLVIEGLYYCMAVAVMVLTVGTGILKLSLLNPLGLGI